MTSPKRKLLIDTDAGVDDAQAILMAFSTPEVDVIGITCVAGNAAASQVGKNVLRVLQVSNKMSVPVYVGCNIPLIGDVKPRSHYHGDDGFGDVADPNAPDESHIQTEHAVQALVRFSKEYQGSLELVCIGPLTNVAMAIRMDPAFGTRLKKCYIMGGNYQGKGNMTAAAEFNFYYDPEAAYVVLNEIKAPLLLLPWEVCDSHSLPWDFYHKIRDTSTPKSDFLKRIESKSAEYARTHNWGAFVPADEVLMSCVLLNDVITSSVDVYSTVETKGRFTWGQMVVDWNSEFKKPPNMTLVTNIDEKKYFGLLYRAVDRIPPQIV